MVSNEYKAALVFTAKVFAVLLACALATAASHFLGLSVLAMAFSYGVFLGLLLFFYGMLKAGYLILSGRATTKAKR
jgi:hypothetical protein